MKIKYEFADGTVSEVEVEESIGAVIIEDRRLEDNLSRKERYHCYSLDAAQFEGAEYSDGATPESVLMSEESTEELQEALGSLTEVQKERVRCLADGLSINEIARREGVAPNAVMKSVKGVREKLKNFLSPGVYKTASESPYGEGHENSRPSEMEVMGMEHILRISVSKESASGGIVSCRHISVRERFLRFLLGEKRRLTIIVSGDSVRELAVSEVMEGGNVHGKSEVTA